MIHLKETWLKNYGKEWNGEPYHIDHIIPLATATSEKEIIDLCYYKNLQMLTPKDNLVKNKYIIDENKWFLDTFLDTHIVEKTRKIAQYMRIRT